MNDDNGFCGALLFNCICRLAGRYKDEDHDEETSEETSGMSSEEGHSAP